jgi:hypothetical protein
MGELELWGPSKHEALSLNPSTAKKKKKKGKTKRVREMEEWICHKGNVISLGRKE